MCQSEGVSVKLRIEGKTSTNFEGTVITTFHRVYANVSGQQNKYQLCHCNGLNNDNNPCPGPTCTTALDDASKIHGFVFDATHYDTLDDLQITSIAGQTPGTNEFWVICRNFRPLSVGGCQQIVKKDDEVLFAYAATFGHANPTKHYLRLDGPTSAPVGTVTLTVTDGGGAPIQGAKIKNLATNTDLNGETDAYGKFAYSFQAGSYRLKAHKGTNLVFIRSNRLNLVVRAPLN